MKVLHHQNLKLTSAHQHSGFVKLWEKKVKVEFYKQGFSFKLYTLNNINFYTLNFKGER